ncbi:hypothetical protein GIB67_037085, partial [Kingdonia uniflora]
NNSKESIPFDPNLIPNSRASIRHLNSPNHEFEFGVFEKMADKPSRGLVLYGDGLVRLISPSHTHLHELASRGSCGFLSLINAFHSESEDERVVRELAQLLDAYDAYITTNKGNPSLSDCQKESRVPTISDRFMGLKAAIVTTNSSVKSFANFLGLSVFQFDEVIKNNKRESTATELLELLGFQGGKTLETCEFNLVFVHIGRNEKKNDLLSTDGIKLINELVGETLQIAQHGSEIGSRLHFSIVMSYGALSEDEDPSLSSLTLQKERNPNLSVLFPRQSYTMKGSNLVDNIRQCCPILIAQWQDAVTRKDMAETFSFDEFKEIHEEDISSWISNLDKLYKTEEDMLKNPIRRQALQKSPQSL